MKKSPLFVRGGFYFFVCFEPRFFGKNRHENACVYPPFKSFAKGISAKRVFFFKALFLRVRKDIFPPRPPTASAPLRRNILYSFLQKIRGRPAGSVYRDSFSGNFAVLLHPQKFYRKPCLSRFVFHRSHTLFFSYNRPFSNRVSQSLSNERENSTFAVPVFLPFEYRYNDRSFRRYTAYGCKDIPSRSAAACSGCARYNTPDTYALLFPQTAENDRFEKIL